MAKNRKARKKPSAGKASFLIHADFSKSGKKLTACYSDAQSKVSRNTHIRRAGRGK